MALSSGLAAWGGTVRDRLSTSRRMEARWIEAGGVAVTAQRWLTMPAAWGGSADGTFSGATLAALGLPPSVADGRAYRTAMGRYRLFPIAPRRWTGAWATALGDAEAPGLIVVGAGDDGEDAVALLAVGGVIVHRLPRVPLDLIRAMAQPPPAALADPATPSAPMPALRPARRLEPRPRPTRHRRTPRPSTQRLPVQHPLARFGQPARSYPRSDSQR